MVWLSAEILIAGGIRGCAVASVLQAQAFLLPSGMIALLCVQIWGHQRGNKRRKNPIVLTEVLAQASTSWIQPASWIQSCKANHAHTLNLFIFNIYFCKSIPHEQTKLNHRPGGGIWNIPFVWQTACWKPNWDTPPLVMRVPGSLETLGQSPINLYEYSVLPHCWMH